MSKSVARLYEQFQPENYQLRLIPDREAMTFTGSVTVRGKKTGRPSQRLTFHQKGLKITSATATKHDKKGNQEVVISRINNQDKRDEVRLHSQSMVYPGEYTITMEFLGEITKSMNGIYPCFFRHEGVEKKLIATQFESHHAREAFPCIDEPEAKATIDLSLTTPRGETVLANTPVKKEAADGNKIITTFETTPRMSTYLLAFVYGELGYREAKTKAGVTVRTYATPGNVALTDYGLQVAVRTLEFFSDYFAVAYPLPKLDMVALPDFSSGAMENWGLVTYRETAMLADPNTSSIESKQMVALVIAHELSHQWFGNLVTMKWWDDLWLNESFANMMEYLAIDALHPEWRVWEQFVSHESASAKRRDSLTDVQSVKTEVHHPDEISTLFDPSIVYAKGGSILHMLMRHIGDNAFRAGLKSYFDKHRYGNTTADDLWASLSTASNQDVGTLMDGWLHRPGYPLISVNWEPDIGELSLSQARFLSDANAKPPESPPWQVPLAASRKLESAVMSTQQANLGVIKDDAKTLLLNHNGHSYFLPHYTQASHLQEIKSGIRKHEVSDVDRFLLLDDYVLLQRGGVASTTELLELLQAYKNETSETVWGAMVAAIAEVRKLVENDDDSEAKVDGLIQRLVIDLAENLGWDDKPDDSAQTLRLRSTAISMAAGAKSQPVIDEGLRRLRAFQKPGELSASTRTVVYFCGARYGSDGDFTKLVELYKTTQNADEKDELASGITSAKAPERYQQSVELLKSKHIRRQDLLHWYVWLLRNRYSRRAAWDWLRQNWDWIEKEFSSDKSYGYFPRSCGGVFSRQIELEEYQQFFEPQKAVVALVRDITLAEQEITSRVAWRERNEATVKAWLKSSSEF